MAMDDQRWLPDRTRKDPPVNIRPPHIPAPPAAIPDLTTAAALDLIIRNVSGRLLELLRADTDGRMAPSLIIDTRSLRDLIAEFDGEYPGLIDWARTNNVVDGLLAIDPEARPRPLIDGEDVHRVVADGGSTRDEIVDRLRATKSRPVTRAAVDYALNLADAKNLIRRAPVDKGWNALWIRVDDTTGSTS